MFSENLTVIEKLESLFEGWCHFEVRIALVDHYIPLQTTFFLKGVEILMGHGVSPYLGLDEIRSPSLMMIFIIISYLFNCTFWIYPLGFFVGAYK